MSASNRSLPRRVLLVMSFANKSSRDRFSGILRYNLKANWELLQFDSFRRTSSVAELSRILKDWRPDGILSATSGLRLVREATKGLSPRRRPLHVSFECAAAEAKGLQGVIQIDNDAVVRAAADTLYNRGIRHFAFASLRTSPYDAKHISARAKALRREARERDCSFAAFTIGEGAKANDLTRVTDWLTRLPKPCGVLLYNDANSIVAYSACRQAGLAIPEQVFIIGIDNDTMICENLDPPLSSILPAFENSGYLAAERLDDCFHGAKSSVGKFITYGVKSVIERGSTLNPSGASRYVYRARDYLDQNPDGRLTVVQIAAALNLSPRLLEKHFAQCVGHTLQQEMLDRRFDRLLTLLRTTDRSIAEVIDLCGWSSVSSAKRLFRERYGCSMRDYRKRENPK